MDSFEDLFFNNPYVRNLIRYKSHEVARQFGLGHADREDIEQELLLDILKRSKHYDHTKSSVRTFSDRLVSHRIASMLEERRAQCRDWSLDISLQEPLPDGDGETWEDIMDAGGNFGNAVPTSSPEHDAADLRLDMERLLEVLSPFERRFCLRLLTQTVAEIAAETGIPASTLYDLRYRLRRIFSELAQSCGRLP